MIVTIKKRFLIILFLMCLVVNFDNASAEKIYRVYNEERGTVGAFVIQYDTELRKYELGLPYEEYGEKGYEQIEIGGIKYELGKYSQGNNTAGAEKFHLFLNDEPVKAITNEQSLGLYYCMSEYYGGGQVSTGTSQVYIFSDSLQRESKEESLSKKIVRCIDLESNEAKTGKVTSVDDCKTFEKYASKIEDGFKDYKNISSKVEANKSINNLSTLCSSITEYMDYDDKCMKKCLGLTSWLEQKKKEYKIGINGADPVCGFSGRLILFVGNIIKWCKYIVPVIAIVLSILDFIKAIGAGKEDEMKKAQGKFIKRLIVAGLVFIMPFIIEFILNKMGFEANGCGIIDL